MPIHLRGLLILVPCFSTRVFVFAWIVISSLFSTPRLSSKVCFFVFTLVAPENGLRPCSDVLGQKTLAVGAKMGQRKMQTGCRPHVLSCQNFSQNKTKFPGKQMNWSKTPCPDAFHCCYCLSSAAATVWDCMQECFPSSYDYCFCTQKLTCYAFI